MANNVTTKHRLFDGKKSVDIWNGDEGWTILSGGEQGTEADYYKFIPTLYRAVQLRSYSVSTMPFEILKGKAEYDKSADWQNKVGFLPNPVQLLQLIEAALTMCGRAYVFKERSVAATKRLRYHLPLSITPEINQDTGEIEYFERPNKNGTKKKYKVEDYVYFWLPDPYVEVGPPINYPAQAAANACGVLKGIDTFAASFFERGAIKAMLLTVKGMPAEAERQKLESWWARVVGGIQNAFGAKVVNAEAVTPVVVGEGIKELENVSIGTEKREDIALAVGIPMSILFAGAANYATAAQDDLNFLTKTIIPECEFIAAVLNDQLFTPLGLHWNFLPETLDAMQEDEKERSVALGQLVTALADPISEVAMSILGYELDKETMAKLQKLWSEKQKRADDLAKQMAEQPEPEDEEQNGEQDTPEEEAPVVEKKSQGIAMDLQRWERKSLNALKRGKPADVPFESVSIPDDLMEKIRASLINATTAGDVRSSFAEVTETPIPVYSDGMLALAEQLRRANDLLEETQ